jgi:hypothetical protein
MKTINRDKFTSVQFATEMTFSLNIITTLDRCRRLALAASINGVTPDDKLELALQPVAMTVRAMIQRDYLDKEITRWLDGDRPSPHNVQKVEAALNSIADQLKPRIDGLDAGITRTMEFALFPERRKNDWALLEAMRTNMLESKGLSQGVASLFCDMAAALGKDSKLIRALRGIVENPAEPVRPDSTGDLIFLLPLVTGPNDFRRPFGLDTKHGHLVFVFVNDQPFKEFIENFTKGLKPGFELKRAVFLVPRVERLGPELAALMPSDTAFQVVLEGTDAFSEYFSQLVENTIWANTPTVAGTRSQTAGE